jgi:hypothetical protein
MGPQPLQQPTSVVMGPGSRSLWTTPCVARSTLVRDDVDGFSVFKQPRRRIPAALTCPSPASTSPSKIRGRRECRALGARSLVQDRKHTSVVTTVTPVSPGIPRASGFNGFLRALPGDRAFLSPSQATMPKHQGQLDASVEASGPHDFAVRPKPRSSDAAKAAIASRTQRS